METFVHETLGKERVKEICKRFSLTEKDEQVVNEILVEWENNLGQPEKKMAIALQKSANADNPNAILKAMIAISLEFYRKRQP